MTTNTLREMKRTASFALAITGALAVCQSGLRAAEEKAINSELVTVAITAGDESPGAKTNGTRHATVVVKAIEPTRGDRAARKDLPWLGVSADEATEVVTAQLDLDPGVGLVVTYVAPDSPAAKAGLKKNDVLVELEGQWLVHPAQLRKLVQARKEGDRVKLVFYRGGKKQTVSATLAKMTPGFGLLDGEHAWHGDLHELHRQLRELPVGDAIREQVEVVRKSLGNVQVDQKQVQEEIRRSMTEARKALQEALKQMTNAGSVLGPAGKALRDLERHGADLDRRTTVTVRKSGQAMKSIVKSDETGTLVLIKNPKLHLTVHDPAGKLVFDGEIETVEQRAKVPAEVWERVEPLLKKLETDAADEDIEGLEKENAAAGDALIHREVEHTVLEDALRLTTPML